MILQNEMRHLLKTITKYDLRNLDHLSLRYFSILSGHTASSTSVRTPSPTRVEIQLLRLRTAEQIAVFLTSRSQ